jgi:hypothetical protein
MIDYRKPENRMTYFKQLYNLNLVFRIHPGLVYLYMPELKKHYNWSDETALYFATINGHTQNPITSLKIMEFIPALPQSNAEWKNAQKHFDEQWANLSFDTDRNKQKKDTIKGLHSYAELVQEAGSQAALWSSKKRYEDLWKTASGIHSFGRLSTFSYLEYIKLNGFGSDCTDLMFDDFSGSRSHRNGMFFLLGSDDYVFDKRLDNGHTGKYAEFGMMCEQLETSAEKFLREFQDEYGYHPNISKFTIESCLCQFKNGFFSRRYPGVYADMAWDRIKWYDKRGMKHLTQVFKDIRKKHLPEWLREECEEEIMPRTMKAAMFAETGSPFRAKHILEEV